MGKTQITAERGMPQIIITREFDAPRELVFRAFTEPELLVQWLGPRDLTMTIDQYDVRDGGRWRYVHKDAQGTEYGFHGLFHGTPSPDGAVQTFEFEGMPGHVSLDTADIRAARWRDAGPHSFELPVRRGPRRNDRGRHGARCARLPRASGRAAGEAAGRLTPQRTGAAGLASAP